VNFKPLPNPIKPKPCREDAVKVRRTEGQGRAVLYVECSCGRRLFLEESAELEGDVAESWFRAAVQAHIQSGHKT